MMSTYGFSIASSSRRVTTSRSARNPPWSDAMQKSKRASTSGG